MKKRLGAILIIMLVLMTTACGNSNSEEEPNGADSQMADDTENNSVILPSPDKIIAVSLEHDGTVTNYDDKEWVGEFINILMDMDITDELSVQDMPDIDDNTKIDIVCNDGTISTLFYYEKDGVSYVEQPYQGIYEPAPALGYYIESLLGGLTVDYPAMLMVDGQLYSGGGTVLTASLPLEADGQIISTCNGVPIKDGQSNFGSGYSYKYGADDTINILLDDNEWHIFVLVDVERTIDMDSLSKQERMEVDPNYIPDNERPAKPIEGAPTNVSSPIDGVTMEVTECSDTSVTVKITNDTDKDIECGDDFYLEVQDEESGEWRELDTVIDSYGFHETAHMIIKDSPYEIAIDFEWLYGKLEPGRYQITKTVMLRETGDHTNYVFAAEFGIHQADEKNQAMDADVLSPIDGVTMEVTEYSDTSVTVKSVNDTEKYILCGDDFYLEIQGEETGEWRKLNTIIDNAAFDAIAHIIQKDSPYEMVIDFEWLYGKLEPGRYHIVKTITDFRSSGDYTDYIYTAEFNIVF